MARKPLTLDQWARTVPVPTVANHNLEQLFFEGHWRYGGRIHEETARALVERLGQPSEMAVGHNLYLRLFAEYGTALETLGGWGWSFRNYRSYKLFLDAFLAYPQSAPRQFFTAVRLNRSGSLTLLLKLSPSRRLAHALAAGFEITEAEFEQMAAACIENLRRAADQYFREDEITRATYNKAKHGATLLRTPELGPRQFHVVLPHLRTRGARDRARYTLSTFTVDKTMIGALEHGIGGTGAAIRFLAGVARSLHRAGLLYRKST